MGLFSKRDPDGPPDYGSLGGKGATGVPQPMLTGWACMTLSSDDRIRLINFPPSMTDIVRQTIVGAWPKGIDKEKDLAEHGAGVWEFKMKGYPWTGQGSEAVPSKRLMIHVFKNLSANGWHVAASSDLSKKSWDKDSLIFRAGPPVNREVFAVTFNEWDKLRLIDSPNDAVHQAFFEIGRAWPQGIHYAKEKEAGCYQFKLRGYPWMTSDGKEVTHSRILCMQLMASFDQLGYELLATVDMYSGIGEDTADVDAWFFASKI